MTVQEFELDQIQANPYQTRKGEDPQHVKNLALSIGEQGLLQIPSARLRDGKPQLVFGHKRLAAFKFLRDTGNVGFDSMPLHLVEMNDEQMFQAVVAENRERKDLTPIEEAEAMLVYRDQFRKTSEEIGKLFHLSDSAVRNKLRLLELPEGIQKVVGVTITEGAAREILTLNDLPEEVQNHSWQWEKNQTLHERVMADAIEGASPAELHEKISEEIRRLGEKLDQKPWKHDEELVGEGIEGICKGCKQLIRRDDKEFCLNSKCYEAKMLAWRLQYLSQASLLSGIPILEKTPFEESYSASHTNFRYGNEAKLKKIRKNHCENLRLRFPEDAFRHESPMTNLSKEGFPLVEIVCCKRSGHCTCLNAAEKGVEVAGGNAEDLKEAREQMREQERINKELIEHLKKQAAIAIERALRELNVSAWKTVLNKIRWNNYSISDEVGTIEQLLGNLAVSVSEWGVGYYSDKKHILQDLNKLLNECGLAPLDISFDEPAEEKPVDDSESGKTLMEVFAEGEDENSTE